MKIVYDAETDVLRILFGDAAIEESDEEKPDIILKYDEAENIVELEILDISKQIVNLR
jgi:uncharacterized protein YuzE